MLKQNNLFVSLKHANNVTGNVKLGVVLTAPTGWPKMNEGVLIRYNFLFKT